MTPRTAILACRVLENEVGEIAAGCAHLVQIEFFEMGLHDQPGVLRRTLADAVARTEERDDVDVIALVFGACGLGTIGLAPRRCHLVMPRAHDCVTLLLGCKERYSALMQQFPGTHWYSPGWVRERRVPGPEREAALRAQYTEQFGAEDAEALLADERERSGQACAAYVDLNLPGGTEARAYARRCAAWLGWPWVEHAGDAGLLRDLIEGRWDAKRFLIVRPGEQTAFSPDAAILKSVAVTG